MTGAHQTAPGACSRARQGWSWGGSRLWHVGGRGASPRAGGPALTACAPRRFGSRCAAIACAPSAGRATRTTTMGCARAGAGAPSPSRASCSARRSTTIQSGRARAASPSHAACPSRARGFGRSSYSRSAGHASSSPSRARASARRRSRRRSRRCSRASRRAARYSLSTLCFGRWGQGLELSGPSALHARPFLSTFL